MAMKLTSALALVATFILAVTATELNTDASNLNNPMYSSLKFPAGQKPVKIEPVGKDTILEEGSEEVVDAKPAGKLEAMDEQPISHALNDVNLPDNEIETAIKGVADQTKLEASVPELSRGARCYPKCRVGYGYCSRACRKFRCSFRVRYRYRIRYRIRYRYLVRYRRRIRVHVRMCRRYKHFGGWSCRYYYVYRYRYVTRHVYRYRYRYVHRYVYRYRYVRGYRCLH